MNVFSMISTKHSRHFTYYALKTFFETTPLNSDDLFLLIDNDKSLTQDISVISNRITLVPNKSPMSFACNVNQSMRIAAKEKADLFFLNNDLIFTPNWITALLLDEASILSPLSNREVRYSSPEWSLKTSMELYDYILNKQHLHAYAVQHAEKFSGYKAALSLPFFCVKIPYKLFSHVGFLDERFEKGGAEDNDYCLRAHLASFPVKYACASFVLHFIGKSTWDGAESAGETHARVSGFNRAFQEKWGQKLTELVLNFDTRALKENKSLEELLQNGDVKSIIQELAKDPRSSTGSYQV